MEEKRENNVEVKSVEGDFHNATGPVRIRMTNDYLFKALLQKNEKVLRGLICSMLHMEEAEICSVDIRNPIILGESISEKDIILDVNVVFNDKVTLDLEMQVVNESNWESRSLYYVCRNYTKLAVGDNYDLAQTSIHIGFLDFTLFEEHSDFYSTYKLLETTHHYEYTDKLQIRVLDLTKIDLATETDKEYNIDKWAQLFKAQTWEDIRMLAVNDQAITEAATTIYQLSEDERIRQQCEAREDYLRRQRGIQLRLDKQAKQLAEQEKQLEENKKQLQEKDSIIEDQDTMIKDRDTTIQEQQNMIKNLCERFGVSEEDLKRYQDAGSK